MLPRSTSLILSAAAFMCLLLSAPASNAQTGLVYFSVGENKAWYSPSTIHVNQSELGNSYNLTHVKANNKTHTPISAFQLNYRLGYYLNYDQTLGIEFNYDPANYNVKDGQGVTLTGMVNSIPNVNKRITFSAKNGYSYKYDGANLMLLNIVRRIPVYYTNNRLIRADVILKAGIGPVMPHVQNSLPEDAADNPQLEWAGWNAGIESALRVSIYRYGFLEVSGKYDYASYSGVNTYQGYASQRLSTYEGIASIGVTIPATKHNPLFYKQTVITIIPLFVDKKDKEDKQAAIDSSLTEDVHAMTDIPEFPELAEQAEKSRFRDSLAQAIRTYYDSANVRHREDSINMVKGDSLAIFRAINPDTTTKANDSNAVKSIDTSAVKVPGNVNVDSLENALMQQGNAPAKPAVVAPEMSKKEKKKLEKQQKKEKKALEKQQELERKNKEAEEKAAKEKADATPKPENTDADKKDTPTPPPVDPEKKEPAPPDTPPPGNTGK